MVWPRAVRRAQEIVHHCGDPKPEHMSAQGVDVMFGEARLLDAHTVAIGEERLTAAHILIATGAHPSRPSIDGLEHALTHVEIERLEEIPPRLVVIGGGIVAFEFAYMFARLGTAVTIVEVAEHVLADFDAEVRAEVVKHATALGMNILTGVRASAIAPADAGYVVEGVRGDDTFQLRTDCVLLAAGQVPTVDGLGLEAAGVRYDASGIWTEPTLRTSLPNVWAAGDVRVGAPQLSMVAQHEGRLAARNALTGSVQPLNERIVPYLLASTPPVASVGLTEQAARVAGHAVGVHRQDYANVCPVANVIGEPDGLVKIVFDTKTGELLGAHVFGAGAPELVQQVALALLGRLSLKDVGAAIFVFPGLTYVMQEALRPRRGDP